MLIFLQMDPKKSVGSFFRRSAPRKPLLFKIERKRPNPRKEKIPVQAMAALEISKKPTRRRLPHDLPTWGQMKTLTNQAENLVFQQGMPQNPVNILSLCLLCLLLLPPAQADLINHTYWAYIPNPPLLQVIKMDRHRTNHIH